MSARVYVHVGAYKTGTKFVQTNLRAAREALATSGVLFPGSQGGPDQVRALKHVLGDSDARGAVIPAAPWERLTAVVGEWSGPAALVSYEGLSVASVRQARTLADGFGPAEVHVVLTARDLARTIPAMWQEMLQGGQTWSWPQYVETVTGALGRTVPPGRNFWRMQDLGRVAETWASAVGAQRVHVVTVPPAGTPPHVLWDRFCAAAGIDAAVRDRDLVAVHESLDVASSDLMRRLNVATEGTMPVGMYDRVLKRIVAKEILAAEAGPERVEIPASSWSWVSKKSQEIAAELAAGDYPVVGALEDLVVRPDPPPKAAATTASTGTSDPEQTLAAAIRVIVAMAERLPPPPRRDERGGRGPARRHQDRPETPTESPPTAGSRPTSRLLRQAYERFRSP